MAIERGEAFEGENAGGSGAGAGDQGGTANGTPASGGGGTPNNNGGTGASGAGSGTNTPSTKFEDDPRYKGILTDVQKERKARQQFEQQVRDIQTRLEERDRQIAALTGSRTPSKTEVEEQQIRERLAQIAPVTSLSQEQLEKLLELVDRSGELESAVDQHWYRHSQSMLGELAKEVSTELGDLSDRQRRKLFSAYVNLVEQNPEAHKRHDKGDTTLVKEFAKEWIEDFVEPVRRKTVASEVGRRQNVPSGKDRSVPMNGDKPIDIKDDKAVMDFIVGSRKGKFGR